MWWSLVILPACLLTACTVNLSQVAFEIAHVMVMTDQGQLQRMVLVWSLSSCIKGSEHFLPPTLAQPYMKTSSTQQSVNKHSTSWKVADVYALRG